MNEKIIIILLIDNIIHLIRNIIEIIISQMMIKNTIIIKIEKEAKKKILMTMMNGKISEKIMKKIQILIEEIEKKEENMKNIDKKKEIGILKEIGKKIEKEVGIKNGKKIEEEIRIDIEKGIEIEKNFLMKEIKDIIVIATMGEIIILMKEEKNHGIVIVNKKMIEIKKIIFLKINIKIKKMK